MGQGMQRSGSVPYRFVRFAPKAVISVERDRGELDLRSPIPLGPYERSICNYLRKWAQVEPDRLYLARETRSGWVGLSYREVWELVRSLGQAFVDRGLDQSKPIAILSGNSIEHAVVMLAGLAVGVPIAPISPNYSLLPGGEARLAQIAAILKPGLVFAQDALEFERARTIPEFQSVEWVSFRHAPGATNLSDLLSVRAGPGFETAFSEVDFDTVAKILFTSGSTGAPKGVINTQRMLCSVVEMTSLLISPQDVPVQVEWMPWHHTMGGNATFNSVLRNGGTLYIDEGRPTPEAFGKTIHALKSISPTTLQTVPAGFALLVDALRRDDEMRRIFFRRLRRVTYGGAALPEGLIDRFQVLAIQTIGKRIAVTSGYGTTETAPHICVTHWASEESGEIGLPMPGLDLKLLPIEDRYELRVKGPNVTPGYLGRPDLTKAAFDDQGYYIVGDTVSFMDQANPASGLRFAGRLSESFKLSTGTWVNAGALRIALLGLMAPVIQDIVIAGENRDEIAILAWPRTNIPDEFLADPTARLDDERLVKDRDLIGFVRETLERHNSAQSSSTRVAAFRLLHEQPSPAAGEITDKRSVNPRVVLSRRRDLVEDLFKRPCPPGVISLRPR
jgi:feruloyl-CoA synthase